MIDRVLGSEERESMMWSKCRWVSSAAPPGLPWRWSCGRALHRGPAARCQVHDEQRRASASRATHGCCRRTCVPAQSTDTTAGAVEGTCTGKGTRGARTTVAAMTAQHRGERLDSPPRDGPADGPLALCLTDSPTRLHLAPPAPELAAAGYRRCAVHARLRADRHPADGRYQTGALARDANELHQALGGSADAVLTPRLGCSRHLRRHRPSARALAQGVTARSPVGSVASPSSPTASCIGAGTCSSSSSAGRDRAAGRRLGFLDRRGRLVTGL